jgi:integrase
MPGRIVKRAKGSWTVVVDLAPDSVTGRRRQLSRAVRGPKRNAEALLVELLHERDAGLEHPRHRLTVQDYLQRWLADYVETNLAPKTLEMYRQIITGHVLPALGQVPLTGLRPQQLQGWYTELLEGGRTDGAGGLSRRTVLRYHQVLHAALRQAVRWQLLVRNPADAVEPPRPPRRELQVPDAAEVRALLAAADGTPYGPLVRLAILTGMRRGELLGLRWGDVDLDAAVLHVQQSAQRITGQGMIFRQPKTRLSRRAIALSPVAVALLRQHRRRQAETRLLAGSAYEDHGLVFTSGLGSPVEPGNLLRGWTKIIAVAGTPHVRFHDLRHAHATLLLRQGVHPKIVSERLGHASIAITLDTYSHVVPGLQEAAAAQLDALLADPDATKAAPV